MRSRKDFGQRGTQAIQPGMKFIGLLRELIWFDTHLVCPLQKAASKAKLSDMRNCRATVVQQTSKASEMLRIRLVARTVAQNARTRCKLF